MRFITHTSGGRDTTTITGDNDTTQDNTDTKYIVPGITLTLETWLKGLKLPRPVAYDLKLD